MPNDTKQLMAKVLPTQVRGTSADRVDSGGGRSQKDAGAKTLPISRHKRQRQSVPMGVIQSI
jgi:hypothetical protein